MQIIHASRQVLAEVAQVLQGSHTRHGNRVQPHPLESVLLILLAERHYSCVELVLETAGQQVEYTLGARNERSSRLAVPLRIAGRSLGELRVFRDREDSFSADDRVLLKEIARAMTLFLTSTGRYILRAIRSDSGAPASLRAGAGESAS